MYDLVEKSYPHNYTFWFKKLPALDTDTFCHCTIAYIAEDYIA